MTTSTKTQRTDIFLGTQGRIVCPTHAGYSLSSQYAENPHRLEYLTDLDHWLRLEPQEAEQHGLHCEMCPGGFAAR